MLINIILLIIWLILLFVCVRNFVVDKNRSAIVWIIVSILWIVVETFCILENLIPLSWFNTFTNSCLSNHIRIYKLCSSILSFFSYFRTISKLQFLLFQLLIFFLQPSGSSVLFYKLLIFLSLITLLKSNHFTNSPIYKLNHKLSSQNFQSNKI